MQRVDSERTFERGREKRREMTEKYRKMGKERMSEQEEKGQNERKKIITKGSCREEDRQIMRKEKNETHP